MNPGSRQTRKGGIPIEYEFQALPPVQPGVALYTVTYQSEGHRVKALLAIPELTGKKPALVYCRGGYKKVGKVRALRISQLASFGYIVLAPHYRGNEGSEGKDEFGGAELQDVHAAHELLRGMEEVDEGRISLYGFSRGGMMALLVAAKSNGFQAAVVWSGVTDLLLTYEERADLRKMLNRIIGDPVTNREGFLARSPWLMASAVSCPVLIVHGTDDQNVGVQHAAKLAEALAASNKPHELWLAEGAGHLFGPDEIEQYTRRMFDWIESQKAVE